VHPKLREAHDAQWRKFVHPENNLAYDIEIADPSQLPTEEEVRASIPNCAGWGTHMEDCCLTAGFVLDGLVAAHRVTGQEEWAGKARRIFQGLVSLGTVSRTRGFVARGFAPGRKDIYPNSSADQYTSFVFGLWSYARSPIATAPERETAARLLADVAELVNSFGHDVPREDMQPSIYGDTNAINADRACRILTFYKAAYDLTGDRRWRELYLAKIEENRRARLCCHYGPDPWPMDRNLHAVVQNQAAFRLLYEGEHDAVIREAYRKALFDEALCVMNRLPLWRQIAARPKTPLVPARWRDFWPAFSKAHPDYDPALHEHVVQWFRWCRDHDHEFPPDPSRVRHVLPWLRHQTEALGVVMLSDADDLKREAAVEGWPMLTQVEWSANGHAGVWEPMEMAYWRGVEAGVFPRA